tara:strand:+ start:865 stop:1314 length:450 start_codon:yes stop_codon:yes gene_type:complete
MLKIPLVPYKFKIPNKLITKTFYLQILNKDMLHIDYHIIKSNANHLLETFDKDPKWPENISFQDNLNDLILHGQQFAERTAFAFSIIDINTHEYLGCIYIYPTENKDYDCEIYYWVTLKEFNKGFKKKLLVIKNWIKKDWPFKNILYKN